MARTASAPTTEPKAPSIPGIRVGTASWTDRSLLACGRFYPPDAKSPEERLRHYASRFSFVEVDSTYYTVDFEKAASQWIGRTPRGFVFDVKAFRLLTMHQTPPSMLPATIREAAGEPPDGKKNWYYEQLPADVRTEVWRTFTRSLQVLRNGKKLGAVVFQLPPWAMPSPQSMRHLQQCADEMEGFRIAVEFRNQYWLSDKNRRRTLAFLRENGLAYVIVDEPQGFRSSVPPIWEVTDPNLAVVRLHGRNREMWERKGLQGASERFNYFYTEDELREFAVPVRELKRQAKEVHATFNNNYEDYPQRNAQQFIKMLG